MSTSLFLLPYLLKNKFTYSIFSALIWSKGSRVKPDLIDHTQTFAMLFPAKITTGNPSKSDPPTSRIPIPINGNKESSKHKGVGRAVPALSSSRNWQRGSSWQRNTTTINVDDCFGKNRDWQEPRIGSRYDLVYSSMKASTPGNFGLRVCENFLRENKPTIDWEGREMTCFSRVKKLLELSTLLYVCFYQRYNKRRR